MYIQPKQLSGMIQIVAHKTLLKGVELHARCTYRRQVPHVRLLIGLNIFFKFRILIIDILVHRMYRL